MPSCGSAPSAIASAGASAVGVGNISGGSEGSDIPQQGSVPRVPIVSYICTLKVIRAPIGSEGSEGIRPSPLGSAPGPCPLGRLVPPAQPDER